MNVHLGLAGGPVPRDPRLLTPELARTLAAIGVRALVTHFQPPPEEIAGAVARRVRGVLEDVGLRIAQATGYNPNLVHPDPDVWRAGLERLRAALGAARDLGAAMVITGCGSLHPTFFYGPAAGNHLPTTRERLVARLRQAAVWAEDAGTPLALEGHVLTTLDTPEHIREVLDAVDSPWVQANFDPVNLLGDLPALYDNGAAMRRMWEVAGSHYTRASAHVKDIAPQPELVLHLAEVPPGEGLLDFDTFFAVCRNLDEGAALIVEHLDVAQVEAALRFVTHYGQRCGLTFA